jgi:hypothetical protein
MASIGYGSVAGRAVVAWLLRERSVGWAAQFMLLTSIIVDGDVMNGIDLKHV